MKAVKFYHSVIGIAVSSLFLPIASSHEIVQPSFFQDPVAGHYVKEGTQQLDLSNLVVKNSANGLNGVRVLNKATVTNVGDVNVTVTNGKQGGYAAGLSSSLMGNETNKYIKSTHAGKIAITNANKVGITVTADSDATALEAMRNVNYDAPQAATIDITAGNVVLEANSTNGYAVGMWVQNNSTTNTDNISKVTINADNTLINVHSGVANPDSAGEYSDIGIVAYSQGQVEINGNLKIDARTAISTRGKSIVTINKNNQANVQIDGDVIFYYDGPTSGTTVDADVLINLKGSDSYLNGNVFISGKPQPPQGKDEVNKMQMGIASGAQWNTDKSSFVNDLTLDGGVINLNGQSTESLTVDKLSGSGGTLNLAGKLDGDTIATPTVKIGVVATPESTKLDLGVKGVTTDDLNNIDQAGKSVLDNVIFGDPSQAVEKTLTISGGEILGDATLTQNSDGTTSTATLAKNTKLDGYGSIAALSAVQWRHENDTLFKRMGELRDLDGTVGAWARFYGSEQEYGAQSVKAKNTTLQVGADVDVGSGWKVGGAFSYTDGSSTFDMGDSNSNMYGLAAYGTWLAENGQFVDVIAKYSRLSNEFTSGTMKGDFDNNAFSLGAEAGWHFQLNDVAFVEPSAGLTYGRIMGDDFIARNGVRVEQDDCDSLVGRLGVRSGFYFPKQRGNIYARVAVLHDFMGDMEATASKVNSTGKLQTAQIKEELGDTWVEYGIGANFDLSKSTYTFVDLEKTAGGDVKESWKWTVGARYVF